MKITTSEHNYRCSGSKICSREYNPCQFCCCPVNTYNNIELYKITSFSSQSLDITIPEGGIVKHVFNTSRYSVFTFCVFNASNNDIVASLQISPDGVNFMNDLSTPVTVKPNSLDAAFAAIFMQYTAIVITGTAGSKVNVCLQGQY